MKKGWALVVIYVCKYCMGAESKSALNGFTSWYCHFVENMLHKYVCRYFDFKYSNMPATYDPKILAVLN
jgi:hypothetical protein